MLPGRSEPPCSPAGRVARCRLFFKGDKGNYRLHLMLVWVWAAMIPVWYFTGLRNAVAFVGAVSIYANLVGHWSGMQAARASVAIEENAPPQPGPEEPGW